MPKLSSIVNEMAALGTFTEKTAAKSSSYVANWLDKMAEEAEKKAKEDDGGDKCPECGKSKDECTCDSKKEASVNKLAAIKIARAYKKAVYDGEGTQGSTVEDPKSTDGAATNAARDTDQIIPASEVENAADSNPERHNTSTSSDLIEGITPNSEDMAEPLQKMSEAKIASMLADGTLQIISGNDKEMLQKFAGVGYNFLVESYSDQMVQEKIASEILRQKANAAPGQIASAIINGQQNQTAKTAAANAQYNQALQSAYAQGYHQAQAQAAARNRSVKTAAINSQNTNATIQKLASIKKNDPQLFSALHVLAQRNLL